MALELKSLASDPKLKGLGGQVSGLGLGGPEVQTFK